MSRVVVLGSSNTDFVLTGPSLPRPGQTVHTDEFLRAHGGKGANQAVAAARAGASVSFIGAVGDDDAGHAALGQYKTEGLDLTHFRVIPGVPSGVALILVDRRGSNMIAVHGGANLRITPRDIAALPDSLFAPPGVFVAQLETPLEAVAAALARARTAGLVTILNPAPMVSGLFFDPAIRLADILIPNEPEASDLLGIPVVGERKSAEAASRISAESGGHVIITMGSNGLVWQPPGGVGSLRVRSVQVCAVDTVGAGDAFIGAMAARLAGSGATPATLPEHLPDALQWASHAAAISVTRRGAQPSLPTAAEIADSLRRETTA